MWLQLHLRYYGLGVQGESSQLSVSLGLQRDLHKQRQVSAPSSSHPAGIHWEFWG